MNQDIPEDELIIKEQGALGVITLNRPRAMNALSLEMIRKMASALNRWAKKSSITAVFITGTPGGAFCAGGDVKAFYHAGMAYRQGLVDSKVPVLFFAEEYSLNQQIFHYPKPIIAFMNGLTMGGGYGVAGNCQYKIVAEDTVFAMPEVGIGFFPDVGSVYHLNQCVSHFGRYLALTGETIKAGDMIKAGLADYYIRSGDRDILLKGLAKAAHSKTVDSSIEEVLLSLQPSSLPDAQDFERYGVSIEKAFGNLEIESILEALREDGSLWAIDTFDTLHARAPTSVKVTAAHLRKGSGQSFDHIIRTDFILAQHFVQSHDFYEGIRAAVIDKDKEPAWEPYRFEGVSDRAVEGYFEPTGYALDDVQIFAEEEKHK